MAFKKKKLFSSKLVNEVYTMLIFKTIKFIWNT